LTLKELSQLYNLKREIEEDKQRLAALEAEATSTSATLTGMPHGAWISDKTSLGGNIADLIDTIKQKIDEKNAEYKRLYNYINSIPNSYIRRIFALRFIDGLSWTRTAMLLRGTTPDAARKTVIRYINNNNA
jgi:hypothetical protein